MRIKYGHKKLLAILMTFLMVMSWYTPVKAEDNGYIYKAIGYDNNNIGNPVTVIINL